MLKCIVNFFKTKNSYKNNTIHYYNEHINRALKYQEYGKNQEALEIYEELYITLKENNCKEKLAIVLNNMIVVQKKLNSTEKELFDELLQLRLSLMIQYEEYYTIDYIHTLLMGLEWFDLPKEKLTQAEKLIERYSNFRIHQPLKDKISELQSKYSVQLS